MRTPLSPAPEGVWLSPGVPDPIRCLLTQPQARLELA